jgi:hypothetical protein
MMQREDSAKFMYSIAKRARKYYLGLTTITQDVADFMSNDMGKAIISNSSIQMLMMQSPSAVEKLQMVFNLSDGERNFLLNCDRGQGLFFAGSNHVGIQVLSSQAEHELITSDPKDLEEKRRKEAEGIKDTRTIEELSQVFDPPAVQQPMKDGQDIAKNLSMIQRAAQRRKEDSVQIQEERKSYEQELREKLEQQDREMNPDRYAYQKTFQDSVEENTIPGQVVKNRRDLQQGRQHMTPQGMVDYTDSNGQQ